MKNESQAETSFVKDVKAQGGVAFKLRHRFMAGLPDTFVKLTAMNGVFLEFKYADWPKKKLELPLKLTPLQRQFMRNVHRVGQPAGWVLFTTHPERGPLGFVGVDHDREFVVADFLPAFTRPRGAQWPVRDMVALVCMECGARRAR